MGLLGRTSRLAAPAALAFSLLSLHAGVAGGATRDVPRAGAQADWTVYHGSASGSGFDTSGDTFSPAASAWKSTTLDGQVYGEPLAATGRVFVATENDTVYALAADSGAVLWSTHLGTPVPSGDLPCGDISPTVGITGTPVVDTGRGEIFAVADVLAGGAPAHQLVGLNIYSGAVILDQNVDPPGVDTTAILQRTGLNLAEGKVVFGYGGNDGDCSTYNGWVSAVPEGGGAVQRFKVDSGAGETQGAIWMGGAAPEVDASGNVWVAAGNGSNSSSSDPYDDSDSVLELNSQMGLEQFFAPSSWYSDNGSDLDLGSAAPALLANGTVLQVGKSHHGYLLNQANLGGIGHQLATGGVCSNGDPDGGDAVNGTVVYIPCGGGIEEVQTSTSPAGIGVAWQAADGESGPPIVAGGLVWSIGGSALYGVNPASGATVQQLSIGGEANHFPTPSVGDGLLLAPSTDKVYAFSGSAGIPGPPSAAPPAPPNSSYWLVASDGGIFSFGNARYFGSMGGDRLAAPMVAMAPTPGAAGYWLVASDGGIFTFGNAGYHGSVPALGIHVGNIVGIAPTADGGGYWLVGSDGGVFSFGDATYHGSVPALGIHVGNIVGIAPTADGGGYWLVGSDGGVFSFGDAVFHGSMGGHPLNRPVVGIARTSDGGGYWLVASDGGIFTFGDAPFDGSAGDIALNRPVVGMAPTPDGGGYWLVASDGGIFTYGDAQFSGSTGGVVLNAPVVGMGAAG